MKNKKLTKAELRQELSTIINTVDADYQEYEDMLVNNVVYNAASHTEGYDKLDKAARIVVLTAIRNHDHIMRKLCKLSHNI